MQGETGAYVAAAAAGLDVLDPGPEAQDALPVPPPRSGGAAGRIDRTAIFGTERVRAARLRPSTQQLQVGRQIAEDENPLRAHGIIEAREPAALRTCACRLLARSRG